MTTFFNVTDTSSCFTVHTTDDTFNEPEETFSVVVTTQDPGVVINPSRETVIIQDDDGITVVCPMYSFLFYLRDLYLIITIPSLPTTGFTR